MNQCRNERGNVLSAACAVVALTVGLGLASDAHAQTITHVPLYTLHGDSANDLFGYSVSGAGDVNGDGLADLIVGAPFQGTKGSAQVFSGSDGKKLFQLSGDSNPTSSTGAPDFFGSSVSGAGDVNGDGRPDLIVGAHNDDASGVDSGSAHVFSGTDGSQLFAFEGDRSPFSEPWFGRSVSGAGDVNGDGFADLIVGALNHEEDFDDQGRAYVFSGEDGSKLFTLDGDHRDKLGSSVSGAGDVNGDGFADFIVGASRANRADIFSGSDGSKLFTVTGDSGEGFGASVSGAGDINGDGTPDLIVGATGAEDDSGSRIGGARVFSGSDGTELFAFHGDSDLGRFGVSVSGAGDVNGDGFADLIVGASREDRLDEFDEFDNGKVSVFSGLDGSTLYTFEGDGFEDEFGVSVSGAGDVNGDGIADFIVGAPFGGLNDDGYARVFVSHVVPEPASAAMLAFGGLTLLRRRRGGRV